MADLATEYQNALDDLNSVLDQAGSWFGGLFGADETAPFQADRDKIQARWDSAVIADDTDAQAACARDMDNLASNAHQTLLGEQGQTTSLGDNAPMGQAPPSANNTVGGNLADQAANVGKGLAIGAAGLGTIALVALAVYVFVAVKK